MKKAWEKTQFIVNPYKGSNTSIIAQISFEEINAQIDEHAVLTQQMMSSCKILNNM